MTQFVQESLSTIRRRVGYLVYRDRFLYGALTGTSASTITLQKAKRLPAGTLTGSVVYVLDGDAAGDAVNVSTNEQGTGIITVTPSFASTPAAADTVEIWPDGVTPDQINQYINLSILDVQHLTSVIVRAAPTVADDRLSVTIDSTWNKVARLTFKYADGTRFTLRPRGPLDPIDSPDVFDVQETALELKYALPEDITGLAAIGYRMANLLDADTDLAEVRSDFLVYKAASLLASADAEGPTLDPENHQGQANTWTREAEKLRNALSFQHLANTHRVDQVF
jgi:hypothetical protein